MSDFINDFWSHYVAIVTSVEHPGLRCCCCG